MKLYTLSLYSFLSALVTTMLISTGAHAGSFDCQLAKGGYKIKLVQTGFAENDPEEESEAYEIGFDNIKASVNYTPYQHGLILILKATKENVEAETNFDLENDEYTDLSLKIRGVEYTLACLKKVISVSTLQKPSSPLM